MCASNGHKREAIFLELGRWRNYPIMRIITRKSPFSIACVVVLMPRRCRDVSEGGGEAEAKNYYPGLFCLCGEDLYGNI